MSDEAKWLYLFLDEGGDLNFGPGGTAYFTMTGVATERPFDWDFELTKLRFDLLETGLDLQCFHASDDRQAVREQVFTLLSQYLPRFQVTSVIVRKSAVPEADRSDQRFYPTVLAFLVSLMLDAQDAREIIVITDRLPMQRKRAVVEKAIKATLADWLSKSLKYRLCHHESKSCGGLQVADYFNWAVFRANERGDDRSLRLIRTEVQIERFAQ